MSRRTSGTAALGLKAAITACSCLAAWGAVDTVHYWQDGQRVGMTVFKDSTGVTSFSEKPEGTVTRYYGNDPAHAKAMEIAYEGGIRKSVAIFDKAGNRIAQYAYDGERQAGWQLTFHPNGKLFQRYQMARGNAEGVSQDYYENGVLAIESVYKAGALDGELKVYAPEGRLWYRMHYRKGLRDGKAFLYYPSGKTKGEYLFLEGKPIGIWKGFHESGSVSSEFEISDWRITSMKCYGDKGKTVECRNLAGEQESIDRMRAGFQKRRAEPGL